jgi:hypothetical protein
MLGGTGVSEPSPDERAASPPAAATPRIDPRALEEALPPLERLPHAEAASLAVEAFAGREASERLAQTARILTASREGERAALEALRRPLGDAPHAGARIDPVAASAHEPPPPRIDPATMPRPPLRHTLLFGALVGGMVGLPAGLMAALIGLAFGAPPSALLLWPLCGAAALGLTGAFLSALGTR